jgi:adenylate cyclase
LAFDNNWTGDAPAALRRADELATQSVRLAPNNPSSHFVVAVVARTSKDFVRSRAAVDKALSLNPNHSSALYVRGANEIFAGDPAAAIPFIERAMRIDPKADRHHLQFLGLAHFLLGNYETAATVFKQRIVLVPQTDVGRVMLAATLGQLGEADEARRIWRELMEINPKYSLREHLQRLFGESDQAKTITEGLAKVGLHG